MKILYTTLLLAFSTSALATTPAEYGQYTKDNWSFVKQEAQNNKAPVPSEQAYTRMTERDENSINHNGGKIIRYDSEGRVYYDYSEGNSMQK